jgi:NTE family protein
MTRVGLVLGAGGIAGQAYHAGVLAALEHDLGWDPRTAAVIVGTSAGAITGTLLRLGIPAHDLAAWSVRAPLSVEGAPLRRWLGERHPEFPPLDLRHWLRRWRPPPPAVLRRLARRPWTLRPSTLAMTMLPRGAVELRSHTRALDADGEIAWPDDLWLCAARRDDGERVVFGRAGAPGADLPAAVAASCAIPGYFTPVMVGGVEYFDGGVHSATNADVLAAADLDLVVIIAPMSTADEGQRFGSPLRRFASRRLTRELARLGKRAPVVRFEPGADVRRAMGSNQMAPDCAEGVVQAAFVEAGACAAGERATGCLVPLDTRRGLTVAGAAPA